MDQFEKVFAYWHYPQLRVLKKCCSGSDKTRRLPEKRCFSKFATAHRDVNKLLQPANIFQDLLWASTSFIDRPVPQRDTQCVEKAEAICYQRQQFLRQRGSAQNATQDDTAWGLRTTSRHGGWLIDGRFCRCTQYCTVYATAASCCDSFNRSRASACLSVQAS